MTQNGITTRLIEISAVLGTLIIVKYTLLQFNIVVSGTIGVWCAIFLATFFLRKKDINWNSLGLNSPKSIKQWMGLFGLTILGIFILWALQYLTRYTLAPLFELASTDNTLSPYRIQNVEPITFILFLIFGPGIGAGIGEEMLFRGFLLNHLEAISKNKKLGLFLAILGQGLIFGAFHSYQGSVGIVTNILVGIAFGTLYIVSGRKLFPLAIAHTLSNMLITINNYKEVLF